MSSGMKSVVGDAHTLGLLERVIEEARDHVQSGNHCERVNDSLNNKHITSGKRVGTLDFLKTNSSYP